MTLVRVVTSYFVAGLLVENGIVKKAAPILRWTVGKPLEDVYAWVKKKGGSMEMLP